MHVSYSYRFDGLAEFISRRARVRLVEMLKHDGLSTEQIAAATGVTARSIRRWLNPKQTHPCNRNLDRLLELAWQIDREQAFDVLRDDLGLFAQLLSVAAPRQESDYRAKTTNKLAAGVA